MRRYRLVVLVVSLAFSFLAALTVSPVRALSGMHTIQAGASVTACGGFAPYCHVANLSGNMTLVIDGDEARIERASLWLIDENGRFPFPSSGDVAFKQLVGHVEANGELSFVAPPGTFQIVSLRMVPFGSGPGKNDGYVLGGLYDEGCCDRFVYNLGNVVVRRFNGEESATLAGGRFDVQAAWRRGQDDEPQEAGFRLDGPMSARFYFFNADNPELFVKVVDACTFEDPGMWFFAAGLTNLEVVLTVHDNLTDVTKVYQSDGEPFPSIIDIRSFPCATS